MTDTNEELFDEDDILDMTLDDLEDLPEFAPYPPGVHVALISMERKEVNDKPSVTVDTKYVACKELASPTEDTEPKEGAVSNILCGLQNEFGRGMLKRIATPIGEHLGISKVRDVIEATKEIECVIVTSIRVPDKKNEPDKKYMVIKELYVVGAEPEEEEEEGVAVA